MWKFKINLSWKAIGIYLFVLMLGGLSACAERGTPPKLVLDPVSFADLPGWNADRPAEAIPALQRSCGVLMHKAPESSLGVAGKVSDWTAICDSLIALSSPDDKTARAFFESHFQPYAAHGPDSDTGLFTGYYEAELHGARERGGRYQTPLYARPNDLISVDLGLFKLEWKGQHIEGKVVKNNLQPYDDRAAIESNSLEGRAQALVWVDDPVDAFFLAVQGSGRVVMENGDVLHVGYDAPNGRAYVAIGRVMTEAGDIAKPVTMQKIRAWLHEHPERAKSVMNANPSYIFFRIGTNDAPVGAEGVELTPRRSLAVDPAFVPLGVPLWLDTVDGNGQRLQKLMVAQDTGGAIKGTVRGDVFWGFGTDAENEAGAMQGKGEYYLLLPK